LRFFSMMFIIRSTLLNRSSFCLERAFRAASPISSGILEFNSLGFRGCSWMTERMSVAGSLAGNGGLPVSIS